MSRDQLKEYVEIALHPHLMELGLMTRTTMLLAQKSRADQGEEQGQGGRHHHDADVAHELPWKTVYLLTVPLAGVRLVKHAVLCKTVQFMPIVVMMLAVLIGKIAVAVRHHAQWLRGLALRRHRWRQST